MTCLITFLVRIGTDANQIRFGDNSLKIQQKDFYHGAALTQIVEHDSFKALNKADTRYGHYQVNTDRRLFVKLTAQENPPWQFTFQPDELNSIRSDIASGFNVFVVLVCGEVTICLLTKADLSSLIDLDGGNTQWVRVEIPKARMRVRGSVGSLNQAVAHNHFPNNIFA